MAITDPELIDEGRPARCDLHSDPEYRGTPYVCNLRWSALKALRMDSFPAQLVIHLEGELGTGIDSLLSSIVLCDLEVSKDELVYDMGQDCHREWNYFLFRTLELTGWVENDPSWDLDEGFDILSGPTPQDYVRHLAEIATKHGFEVNDRSSDVEVCVTLRKKPTRLDGSVFDCVAAEFRQVNKEMMRYLAQSIVLIDYDTEEEVRFAGREISMD